MKTSNALLGGFGLVFWGIGLAILGIYHQLVMQSIAMAIVGVAMITIMLLLESHSNLQRQIERMQTDLAAYQDITAELYCTIHPVKHHKHRYRR